MLSLREEDWDKLEELVEHHTPDKAKEVLLIFEQMPSDIWVTEDVLGLVAYVHLPIEVDMIIAMQWDNKFTMSQWRKIKELINNRKKEVHINSAPNNKAISKWVSNGGGYWLLDDIVFPKKG